VDLQRSSRWMPLTGVLFVALVIVGGPVLVGSTPGARASGSRVIAFYAAHRGRERVGVFVLAFAFLAFLAFAGTIRGRLRAADRPDALTELLLPAAILLVAGQTVNEGVGFALSDAPAQLSPGAAQALNVLSNDLVVTSAVGFLSFGVVAGIAILRGASLPRWLGWISIAIGILFVIPPIEFAGFLLFLIWVAVVSVVVARRTPGVPDAPVGRS
jgi:hypothetical protein